MTGLNTEELKQLLVGAESATAEQLQDIEKEARTSGISFEEALLGRKLMKESQLAKLIAQVNNWKFVHLKNEAVDQAVLKLVPEEMAKKQNVLAFGKDENGVKVAMADPTDVRLVHLLEKRLGKMVVYYATEADIALKFSSYKSSINDALEQIVVQQNK